MEANGLQRNVNMCESPRTMSDLFPCAILTDIIAGVNILDNKNQPTAHASDLTSNKIWIFSTIVKNSVLSNNRYLSV